MAWPLVSKGWKSHRVFQSFSLNCGTIVAASWYELEKKGTTRFFLGYLPRWLEMARCFSFTRTQLTFSRPDLKRLLAYPSTSRAHSLAHSLAHQQRRHLEKGEGKSKLSPVRFWSRRGKKEGKRSRRDVN